MTEEVQTDRFRNLTGHPVDLTGGKMVPAGGFVDLTADEQKDDHNKAVLQGFAKVVEPDRESVPGSFDREAAMARAKELGVTNTSRMRNDELQTAIIEAEEQKEGDG